MKKPIIIKKLVLAVALSLTLSIIGCEGDPGPEGPVGKQGEQGEPGLNGKDGVDGIDSPNKSFYFQFGFKGYTGAKDTYISSFDPTFNYGDKVLTVQYNTLDYSTGRKNTIIRFDNIAEAMLPYLDDPGTEGSHDDYYINEAVLYLYCYNASSTFESNLSLKIAFYDEADPLFAETVSTWNIANEVQPWAGGDVGVSDGNWGALFPAYSVSLSNLDLYGGSMGWIAVPLPRQVVKSWIDDADNSNRGLRIQLFSDPGKQSSAIVGFYSKEHEVEDLRPLLFINGEPDNINPGGRRADKSWQERLHEWESLPHSDRMAPLNKFLSIK